MTNSRNNIMYFVNTLHNVYVTSEYKLYIEFFKSRNVGILFNNNTY